MRTSAVKLAREIKMLFEERTDTSQGGYAGTNSITIRERPEKVLAVYDYWRRKNKPKSALGFVRQLKKKYTMIDKPLVIRVYGPSWGTDFRTVLEPTEDGITSRPLNMGEASEVGYDMW